MFKLIVRLAVCLALALVMAMAGFGIGGYVLVRLTQAQSDGSLVPATAEPTAAQERGGAPTQDAASQSTEPGSQAMEPGSQAAEPASLTGGAQTPWEPALPPQEPGSVVLPSPVPPEP